MKRMVGTISPSTRVSVQVTPWSVERASTRAHTPSYGSPPRPSWAPL